MASTPATRTARGADRLLAALADAGVERLFTLSGNHIMAVFDASLDADMPLVHVRHEAAAVHMADAWARLSGRVGVALTTAGPGHANAMGALYTAQMAESPVLLLSGAAATTQRGSGAFQEVAQSAMAAPVCKAALDAEPGDDLGQWAAHAMRIALDGRPGPVQLNLPSDVLEGAAGDGAPAHIDDSPAPAAGDALEALCAALESARRPLLLAGPALMRRAEAHGTHIPLLGMHSPRGTNDPALGRFAHVLQRADLVVLLDKALDFTLRFGNFGAAQIVQVDSRARRLDGALDERVTLAIEADAAAMLAHIAPLRCDPRWREEVREATRHRPPDWSQARSTTPSRVHPLTLCDAVQRMLERPRHADEAVLIADGGEFGQWAQAGVRATHTVINGPSGSIGGSVPFALGARYACPNATVVAMMGDGTIGFHLAEFDTAVRNQLPFVAVVGNDACWNAEHQIQLRDYGEQRLVGCDLLPTRYDLAVEALGGHGEYVTRADDLDAALARALGSGKPACVNVMIERHGAPTFD